MIRIKDAAIEPQGDPKLKRPPAGAPAWSGRGDQREEIPVPRLMSEVESSATSARLASLEAKVAALMAWRIECIGRPLPDNSAGEEIDAKAKARAYQREYMRKRRAQTLL